MRSPSGRNSPDGMAVPGLIMAGSNIQRRAQPGLEALLGQQEIGGRSVYIVLGVAGGVALQARGSLAREQLARHGALLIRQGLQSVRNVWLRLR